MKILIPFLLMKQVVFHKGEGKMEIKEVELPLGSVEITEEQMIELLRYGILIIEEGDNAENTE